MAFLLENREGRLVEIRIDGRMTEEEAQQFRTRMYLVLSMIKGRAALVANLQHCEVVDANVGSKMVTMLKIDNAKVERTAFLLRAGPLASQIHRLVAAARPDAAPAGTPLVAQRRLFYNKLATRAWISEVLTSAECDRLGLLLESW
jgi:hypothetical protein